MSIKQGKSRIIIALPDEQIKWLTAMSRKAGVTKSKFISWFLARKADELYNFLKFNDEKPSPQEMEQLLKIIKTKWLD